MRGSGLLCRGLGAAFADGGRSFARVEWCPTIPGLLASGGQDHECLVWRHSRQGGLTTVLRHIWHDAPVDDLQWNPCARPDEALLASCSQQEEGGGCLQVWRLSELLWREEGEALQVLKEYSDRVAKGSALMEVDAPV